MPTRLLQCFEETAGVDDLDEAIALVYAQPPSGFVAARAALVKQLKADKCKDEAARVAALRRPTKLAWAIGDAVRRAPEPAKAFFAAVAGLEEPGADLRQRTAELRKAIGGLVDAIEDVDPGAATAALLATAADPEAGTALRLGRLAEVPAGGGFGGLTLVPEAAAAAPSRAEPQERGGEGPASGDRATDTEPDERERQEREDEAKRQRAERLERLRAERQEAAAAEDAAAHRVEAARAAVEEAQAELERATRELDEARKAASAAAAALDEAAG
jgi:hypothetical protein